MHERFSKILYCVVTKIVMEFRYKTKLWRTSVTKFHHKTEQWQAIVTDIRHKLGRDLSQIRYNPKKNFPLNFPSKLWRNFRLQFKFFRHNIFLMEKVRHNFAAQKIVMDVLLSQLFRHNCDGPDTIEIVYQLNCDRRFSVTIHAFPSQYQHFFVTISVTIQHFFRSVTTSQTCFNFATTCPNIFRPALACSNMLHVLFQLLSELIA